MVTTAFPPAANNRFDRPQVEHRYGQMLVDRGRPEDQPRARELLTSAIDQYQMGTPLLEARAPKALAALDHAPR